MPKSPLSAAHKKNLMQGDHREQRESNDLGEQGEGEGEGRQAEVPHVTGFASAKVEQPGPEHEHRAEQVGPRTDIGHRLDDCRMDGEKQRRCGGGDPPAGVLERRQEDQGADCQMEQQVRRVVPDRIFTEQPEIDRE